jgi:LCP family protein required for cell wall assembly
MVLGIFVVLTGGFVFWRGYTNLHKVFQGTGTVAALSSGKVAPELLKGEGDGRVNILLLGIGGQNHPGGDLTDTIVVLSVDPVNGTAAMLSVPRDLWVKMPVNYFGAYQKINAAYSSAKYKYLGKVDLASTNQQAIAAGFAAIDDSVGDVLGIRISYHILVNFQAFEQAIDSVDGVTVDVASQLYDPTMAWENGNNPILATAGVQNMDGEQALNFVRSRETSSDFARSERQRQLLVALKEKVLTLSTLSSPTRITSLFNTFGNNIHTDLSTQAATRLFSIMKGINDIASLSLTTPTSLVTTDRVGNISVVRPKAGFNTYSNIQTYVRSQLKDGYLVRERASVQVVAANEVLAEQTAETLASYGYTVDGSNIAAGLPAGITIVDKSSGAAPYTLHYLQDRYGLAAINELPKGVQVPNGTQFVIIVGT